MRAAFLLLFACLIGGAKAEVYYVDRALGRSGRSGTSWQSSLPGLSLLQERLARLGKELVVGDEVWLAEGYYEEKGLVFEIPTGVKVRGGYPLGGGDAEGTTESRGDLFPTVVDGARFVLRGGAETSELENLTVQNAPGVAVTGGENVRFLAKKVRFFGNEGAVRLRGAGRAEFWRCVFDSNAAGQGGALYLEDVAWAGAVGCQFSGNVATGRGAVEAKGGAVWQKGGVFRALSSVCYENWAFDEVGVMGWHEGGAVASWTNVTAVQLQYPTTEDGGFIGSATGNTVRLGNSLLFAPSGRENLVRGSWQQSEVKTSAEMVYRAPDANEEVPAFSHEVDFRYEEELGGMDAGTLQILNDGSRGFSIGAEEDVRGLPRTRAFGQDRRPDLGAYEHRPVRFVRPGGTTFGRGLTWDAAYFGLSAALREREGVQLRLESGVYLPTNSIFQIGRNFEIIGGFDPEEGRVRVNQLAPPQSDREAATILDGDLRDDDREGDFLSAASDNREHVLVQSVAGVESVVRNLWIRGGRGREGAEQSAGGGVLLLGGELQLVDCLLSDNLGFDGAGALQVSSGTVAKVTDCLFEKNRGNLGGAAFVSGGVLRLSESVLAENVGVTQGGGLFCRTGGQVRAADCLFETNSCAEASGAGGGIYLSNNSGPCWVRRSIFRENTADFGGAVRTLGTEMVFSNCVLTGNVARIDGGAVAAEGRSNWWHCTLVENDAQGLDRMETGGWAFFRGNHRVIGALAWDNRRGARVADSLVRGDGLVAQEASLIQGRAGSEGPGNLNGNRPQNDPVLRRGAVRFLGMTVADLIVPGADSSVAGRVGGRPFSEFDLLGQVRTVTRLADCGAVETFDGPGVPAGEEKHARFDFLTGNGLRFWLTDETLRLELPWVRSQPGERRARGAVSKFELAQQEYQPVMPPAQVLFAQGRSRENVTWLEVPTSNRERGIFRVEDN